MDAPHPARTTVRGFHGTPVTSGDEDSDYGVAGSTSGTPQSPSVNGSGGGPRRGRKKRLPVLDDVVSANCSPVLRPAASPAVSGIAKLRLQMDGFSLDTSAVSSRASSPGAKAPTAASPRPASMGRTASAQGSVMPVTVSGTLSRQSSTTTAAAATAAVAAAAAAAAAGRVALPPQPLSPLSPSKHRPPKSLNLAGQADFTVRNYDHRPVSSTSTKATSSRSTSHDAVSSNTSGDETGNEAPIDDDMTSYVIPLKHDFVSESIRIDGLWPAATTAAAAAAPVPHKSDARDAIFTADLDDGADLDMEGIPATLPTQVTFPAAVSGVTPTSSTLPVSPTSPTSSTSPSSPAASTAPKKMTADDFEPLRCLGKGSYGTVLLVKQNSTGRLYAQKQFKKASLVVHKKLVQQTKTERQILESVNRHPFVVKLYYAFQDREKLYLILEYGQGGELFTHLSAERMFSEATAAFYMAEMALALSHLHDTLGVVYRDLKPENCLLDAQGHLLLTDFGLSKVALPGSRSGSTATTATTATDDASCCNSMLGTVEYMAPEIVQGQKYGRAVDWWSFGALGFDLMTGNPPFRGRNNAKIQENIVKQKLVLPYFLSPDAKDLLTRLLRKDPRRRLGATMPRDLATLKGHRFFRRIDWARLAARELEPPIQPVITDPELAENFAAEFTDLPLSPIVGPVLSPATAGRDKDKGPISPASPASPTSPTSSTMPRDRGRNIAGAGAGANTAREDPFGGFSFVASTSLLNESHFPAFLDG